MTGLAHLAVVGAAVMWRDRFDAAAVQTWVEGAGAAGPLVFVVVYAVATVLFLPGAVITLVRGTLFGPLLGTVWNLCGATLAASRAFLVARYVGADWVARRAGARLASLNAADCAGVGLCHRLCAALGTQAANRAHAEC